MTVLIRLLRSHLRPYRRSIYVLLVLQAIQALLNLYLPNLNAKLIDNGVLKKDTTYIWHIGAWMLVVAMVQAVFAVCAIYLGSRIAMSFGRDVRRGVFRRSIELSAREVNQLGASSLITRVTNDVQQVQLLVVMTATMVLAAPVTVIGGVILALRQNVGIAWLLFISMPILAIAMGVLIALLVPQFRRMQDRLDAANRVLREQITGIRVIRAFVREPRERSRFRAVNNDLTTTSLAAGRLMALMFPVVMLVINCSNAAVVWFGADKIAQGQMTIGSLIAFLTYFTLILMAVMMATFVAVLAPRAAVSGERIQEVLDTHPSVVPPANPVEEFRTPGTLEMRNVTFAYPGAEAPVVHDITFSTVPGETVAVIGSTGSGKTTLVNLVARLFDATGGTVLVGGVDVREIDPDLLWHRIGLVPQKPYLFSGTVASNLRYGEPDATDEEIWEALDVAQASDFVLAMGGLRGRIEQGGTNVSGGQRQRLSIARALVRHPDVYLFDDSFSALDLATEARLRSALAPYTSGSTVFVVAQRVSTIVSADQIIVLEGGDIVGLGTHSDLLATSATYSEIVASQDRDEAAVTQETEARRTDPAPDATPDEGPARPGQPGGPRMPSGPGPGRMASFGMPLERSSDPGATVRWLMGRFRGEKWIFGVAVVASVCGVFLTVLGPRLLGEATNILVDGLEHGGPSAIDFNHLHSVLFEVVALYVGGASLQYLQAYLMAGVVQRTMRTLRADVEEKLHRLPLSYIDRAARGDLLSRVTNDIDNLGQSLQQTISQVLTNVLMLIGTTVLMFVISPILALVALFTVPLSVLIIRFIMRRARPRFIRQWTETGTLDALAEESLTGHAIVKTFGRQREVEAEFFESNERLYKASFEAQYISSSVQPAMVWIGNINFVAIAVIGGIQVANGALSIGGVQAFIQYSRQFSQPLQMLASMFNLLLSGLASAERVSEVLVVQEESADPPAVAVPQSAWRGRVEFEHVNFSYDPSRPLITDLSIVAEPGRTVAIVGPTGAGKTTLVNLIMRFYELDSGRITLDGVDIATMPRAQLRANIGMVLQDTWLFSGTIRENIAYGNPDATEEQILAAARATYVDRFVHGLAHGYDTVVDDDSGALSAGEKQLLTIARAFLADPTILILDEATSSVDTRTEVLIQDAMAALRSQRTSFVIAHRLSTIRNADTILVMNDGRIVEQGNHDELLARGGPYAELYNAQFLGAAIELD